MCVDTGGFFWPRSSDNPLVCFLSVSSTTCVCVCVECVPYGCVRCLCSLVSLCKHCYMPCLRTRSRHTSLLSSTCFSAVSALSNVVMSCQSTSNQQPHVKPTSTTRSTHCKPQHINQPGTLRRSLLTQQEFTTKTGNTHNTCTHMPHPTNNRPPSTSTHAASSLLAVCLSFSDSQPLVLSCLLNTNHHLIIL